jgi:hypothetical protein
VAVVSFDLGAHQHTPEAARFIQSLFPERLELVVGSSEQTIPLFTRLHPAFRCNLLFIDGSHAYEIVAKDLAAMRALANETYHRVVLDDYEGGGVRRAWKEAEAQGRVAVESVEPFYSRPLTMVWGQEHDEGERGREAQKDEMSLASDEYRYEYTEIVVGVYSQAPDDGVCDVKEKR